MNCPGLQHDYDGAGHYCPLCPEAYPDDWEAFCRECRLARSLADDRAVDAVLEQTGALE